MATIKPFQAIRPAVSFASEVAALPYDVMNSEEARQMVKGKPYSFLHIDKAEIDLPADVNPYSDEVYQKAKANLEQMIATGIFIQDSAPFFYIYRLTMFGKSQTGLVVCTAIDEYLDGSIKKHEFTRADKEKDRIRHVDTLNANTGPIFLAYKSNADAKKVLADWTASHEAIYDFVAEDGIGHAVWVVDNTATIEELQAIFRAIPNLYIADGHHRNASAVKVGLKRREAKPDYTGNEEFNYYLSVLFDVDELHIYDYNRVVKDLNGLSVDAFLSKLGEKFVVAPYNQGKPYQPAHIHTFGVYVAGNWFSMTAKEGVLSADPVLGLDVAILQNEVLTPLLAIGDPRTDTRIDFIGGIRGLQELERRVDSGEMALAFSMHPTSMEELMAVADSNNVMPPKSTWFEPKLRSGVFVHDLGE